MTNTDPVALRESHKEHFKAMPEGSSRCSSPALPLTRSFFFLPSLPPTSHLIISQDAPAHPPISLALRCSSLRVRGRTSTE